MYGEGADEELEAEARQKTVKFSIESLTELKAELKEKIGRLE